MVNPILVRSLFRTLLRATNLLSTSHKNQNSKAIVLNCLFHRTGVEDESWSEFLRNRVSSPSVEVRQEDKENHKLNNEDKNEISDDEDDDDIFDFDIHDDFRYFDGDEEIAEQEHQNRALFLFRKLLREVIAGGDNGLGIRLMQFPCHVNSSTTTADFAIKSEGKHSNRFRHILVREFRDMEGSITTLYDPQTRIDTAFLALREINKKMAWMDKLERNLSSKQQQRQQHQQQQANRLDEFTSTEFTRHIHLLPFRPPSSYLRPGTFLIAHPHKLGYFRKSVVCILEHSEEGDFEGNNENIVDKIRTAAVYPYHPSGTYGVVINRTCISPQSGRNLTLKEVIRPIPPKLTEAFGNIIVKEGGPVHMSIQMVLSSSNKNLLVDNNLGLTDFGGSLIPQPLPEPSLTSTSMLSRDKISMCDVTQEYGQPLQQQQQEQIYFNCDMLKAADAVISGRLNRNDVMFFVGASCWLPGQLESEVERGFWLPCTGIHLNMILNELSKKERYSEPVVTNLSNHHEVLEQSDTWLWHKLLSACGNDEALLAHLLEDDDGDDPLGQACDDLE